ncbi:class I SAM-dependent methyltransferase [Falsarthrobacter nasiphocae]|uniref:16S rRNA G1207 methylase RsmC n=1 Tax=Falsarthrobacter nasiphocae TaxID=189863 RepID=A0AAE3YIP4_9MICC|nr:methyltransferase [Falsarthrobacter nasiphocae]MDR6892678.1 16S rRNA G1207 methylase RsmC [Falsarthrobacter nasiphocae]
MPATPREGRSVPQAPSPAPSARAPHAPSAQTPAQDHYFTGTPEGPLLRKTLTVELAGRTVTVTTASGIFSPGGVDKGTQVLLKNAPWGPLIRPDETVLDIGCGWGPITLTAGLHTPEARLVAVDVNERSLTLARENASALGLALTAGLPEEIDPDLRFERIYSNPPIRVGKAVLHDILRTWLPRLAPGGMAWLVVQKNLGSDSLQAWMEAEFAGELAIRRHSTDKGFRILTAERTTTGG